MTPNENFAPQTTTGSENLRPWRTLWELARVYQGKFLVVVLFSLLATGSDLIAPLIYRTAINDVAGLFVDTGESPEDSELPDEEPPPPTTSASPVPEVSPGATPSPIAAKVLTRATPRPINTRAPTASPHNDRRAEGNRRQPRRHRQNEHSVQAGQLQPPPEPHRSDYVAPRTPTQTFSTLMWAVLLLFVINVIGLIFSVLADNRTVWLGVRIEADLIQSTFGHVLRLPLSFFSRRASGALAKQIDQSDQVAPVISAVAQEIAPEVIRMLGVFIIMATQSWRLTLLALALIPPYLWLARRSAKRLETGLESYYEMWENLSGRIQDGVAAIKTVKLSGAEAREMALFREQARVANDDYLQRSYLANRYHLAESVLSYLSKTVVFLYGGWLVYQHQLTPGDVVMFVVYLDSLYAPMDSLTSLSVQLQQQIVSLKRALRLLVTGREEVGAAQLEVGTGRVEFKDVHFSYSSEREVLQGLSFTLEPGQVTALVGTSGAGKTTTTDLLFKLYEPQAGAILIDGQPLAGLDAASVRRALGVVASDGAVFRGTLAENIRYKRPDASDEDVAAAARAAGLERTLERLPDGLQTNVGESGVGLSVGERQRLQIARVLVSKPRILILDEATANLDFATETEIRHALKKLMPRPTIMVIAHRFSMVEDADQVIVLDNGRVAEQGTPAELIASGGWFAEFAQYSGEGIDETVEDIEMEEGNEYDEDQARD